ncbi:hypothetical protein [Mycolicibacterium sp.]|uniref:hypothetical protein n=1 Tax=Mycolicibacterium sp. TaxID=2320850 RepID=UPI0025F7DCD5|nr:hypothetical protein [Mycolicibacterium sp.]
MTISPALAHYRAKIAAKSRVLAPDDPELLDAKRDLAAAKLAEHVAKVVGDWPTLTEDQLNRVAGMLRGGSR